MARDRFLEFQQRAQQQSPSRQNGLANGHSHPQASNNPSTVVVVDPSQLAHATAMNGTAHTLTVLEQMDELRQSINRLEDRIRLLNQKQSGVLSQTIVGPQSKEDLELAIDEIKQHIRSLRPRIRDIDLAIRRDEQTGNRSGAELRIRRNQCDQLKRRLHEVLTLFNDMQSEYKRRVSRRVKRQLDMAGEYLSADEVDRMLDSNSEEIFYRQINPLTSTARAVLEDATNRHNEILKLERSISELNDLFVEIYELVALQDGLVNNIAKNVETAAEYTEDARKNVVQAVTYKKRAQRKTCMLVIVGIAILVALLVLVLILVLSK